MQGYVGLMGSAYGYVRPYMAVHAMERLNKARQSLCTVMYGYVGLCTAMNGMLRLCRAMYGYERLFRDYVRLCTAM